MGKKLRGKDQEKEKQWIKLFNLMFYLKFGSGFTTDQNRRPAPGIHNLSADRKG